MGLVLLLAVLAVFLVLCSSMDTGPDEEGAQKIQGAAPSNVKTDLPKTTNTYEKASQQVQFVQKHSKSVAEFAYGARFGGMELHIRRQSERCFRKGHAVESVSGRIYRVSGGNNVIEVKYCRTCNIYFWEYEEYVRYRDTNGEIFGNFVMTQDDDCSYNSEHRSHSTLSLCGYSVSSAENKLAGERRDVLSKLVSRGIMNRDEIVKHLSKLIERNTGKNGRITAIKKWSSDIKWLNKNC